MEIRAIKQFGIVLAIAVGVTVRQAGSGPQVFVISDTLFTAGMFLLMTGAAGAVDNTGFFDIVRYGSRCFVDILLNRQGRSSGQPIGFAEFVRRQRDKHDIRLSVAGGMICLLASLAAAGLSI